MVGFGKIGVNRVYVMGWIQNCDKGVGFVKWSNDEIEV